MTWTVSIRLKCQNSNGHFVSLFLFYHGSIRILTLNKSQHLFCWEKNVHQQLNMICKNSNLKILHNFCIPWVKDTMPFIPCAQTQNEADIGISLLVFFCFVWSNKSVRFTLHNQPWLSETKRNWWNCIKHWPNILTFRLHVVNKNDPICTIMISIWAIYVYLYAYVRLHPFYFVFDQKCSCFAEQRLVTVHHK